MNKKIIVFFIVILFAIGLTAFLFRDKLFPKTAELQAPALDLETSQKGNFSPSQDSTNSSYSSETTEQESQFITCPKGNMWGGPVRVKQSAGNTLVTGPTNPEFIQVINPGSSINADTRNTYLTNKNAEPVPIIAPADGTLIFIEYKTRTDLGPNMSSPDYDIAFAADCNTIYRINHITNLSKAIKALSPLNEPAQITPGNPISEQDSTPLEEYMVQAGDILGTTTGTPTAHNWDFVVFIQGQATCPYDILPSSQRSEWLSLLGPSNSPVKGTACTVSGSI